MIEYLGNSCIPNLKSDGKLPLDVVEGIGWSEKNFFELCSKEAAELLEVRRLQSFQS